VVSELSRCDVKKPVRADQQCRVPVANAFTSGARRDAALVAVSTGLLHAMPRDEVEAVLAHEVAHIANGDMVTLTLVQGVVNTFVFFLARVIARAISRDSNAGYFATVLIAQIFLGFLASLVVMWVSRQREFRADAGSANLRGNEPMIRALTRLGGQQPKAGQLPEAMQAFGISPSSKKALSKLLMTHPPIEERIEALRQRTYQ
ncbi:MAG: protease HtpX, partial [Pseudomonadota bacterium]